MNNRTFFISFFSLIIYILGCSNKSTSKIEILPLHPYFASLPKNSTTNINGKSYGVKFYFIKNTSKLNDDQSAEIDSFVQSQSKVLDSIIKEYDRFEIEFFQETDVLNEKFRDNIDGIYGDILDYHIKDWLCVYSWERGVFSECRYYNNGQVYETDRQKVGSLFKKTK